MYNYIEHQKFSKWISFTLGILTVLMIYLTIKSHNTVVFLKILLFGLVPIVLLLLLFLTASLKTCLDKEGIKIKFPPFRFRYLKISWNEIEHCQVRKYRPMLEYVGWGLRYGVRSKAYSVGGNTGIEILLRNGKRIIIGTQRAEEAKKMVNQFVKK